MRSFLSMSHVPIAMAFDRNYLCPAAVAIHSLLTCLQRSRERITPPPPPSPPPPLTRFTSLVLGSPQTTYKNSPLS